MARLTSANKTLRLIRTCCLGSWGNPYGGYWNCGNIWGRFKRIFNIFTRLRGDVSLWQGPCRTWIGFWACWGTLGALGSCGGPGCSCCPLAKSMGVSWLPWLGNISWGPWGPKGLPTCGLKFTIWGNSTSGCCCCSTYWGNSEDACRRRGSFSAYILFSKAKNTFNYLAKGKTYPITLGNKLPNGYEVAVAYIFESLHLCLSKSSKSECIQSQDLNTHTHILS